MEAWKTRRLKVLDSTETRLAYGLIRVTAGLNRYRILLSLREREKNVSELIAELHLKQSTVSHNLRRLIDEGLIVGRAEGAFRYFSINGKMSEAVLDVMDGHAAEGNRKTRKVLVRSLKEAREKIARLEARLRALRTR